MMRLGRRGFGLGGVVPLGRGALSVFMVSSLLLSGCGKKRPPKNPGEPAVEEGGATQPVDPAAEAAAMDAALPPGLKVERAVALLTTSNPEDTARARGLLESVVDAQPDNVFARYNLGVALQRLGDLEGAASELSRVTRADASFAAGWLALALTERQLGDVDAALRHLRAGIVNTPEDLDLHVALVGTLRQLGEVDEAIEEAKKALRINTRSLPLYDEMGRAWVAKGNLDMARFVYEKADQMPGSENNAALQAGFGRVLYLRGDRYASEYRLKKSLEIDPNYLEGQVWLSRLYLDDHNWPAATPLLESATKLDPRHTGVLIELGNAYRGLGRLEDAQRVWRRALELNPKDPLPHFNLGVLLGDDLKSYDDGVKEIEAYLAGGGAEATLATTYIESFKKEKTRAEQRRKQEEDRLRRQKEREQREKEAAAQKEAEKEAEKAQPESPAPEQPAEPEPAPQEPGSPWGPTQPGEGP